MDNVRAPQSPPDWQEILTHFRGSELQNYFTRILEDDLHAIIKPQYVDHIPKAVRCAPACSGVALCVDKMTSEAVQSSMHRCSEYLPLAKVRSASKQVCTAWATNSLSVSRDAVSFGCRYSTMSSRVAGTGVSKTARDGRCAAPGAMWRRCWARRTSAA